MTTAPALYRTMSVATYKRRSARIWRWTYIAVAAITLYVAALAVRTGSHPFTLAGLVLFVLLVVIVARPVTGIWFVIFFALAGDGVTAPWYPFAKNLSSRESILFVANGAYFNPIEICLMATTLGWILSMASTRQWKLKTGRLFRPMMVFAAFIVFGFVNGVSRGGDRYAALWEMRPMFYLVIVYVLATNLLTTDAHYRRLWSLVIAAVVINAGFGLHYYSDLSEAELRALEAIGEHSASIHANTYFILIAALLVMGEWTLRRGVVLLALLPIIGAEYLLAQRRAAFVAAGVGGMLVAMMLFRVNRRAFWRVIPVLLVLFAAYTGAFWNTQGSLGFPAQAVKTIVAPGQLSEKDKSSGEYRDAETFNVIYTIRTEPITGIGFGNKFLRPIPLADISTFVFFEYITHNALHWIWMKLGVGGFIAMLYLFSSAIWLGARRLVTMPTGYDAALVLTAVSYVVMYLVYAYVDIAWDSQSLVLMGAAMAFIASSRRSDDEAAEPERVPTTELRETVAAGQAPR